MLTAVFSSTESNKSIAKKYSIRYTTLHARVQRARQTGIESASSLKKSYSRAVFTPVQEKVLYQFIMDNYITTGIPFVNGDLKHAASAMHNMLYPYSTRAKQFSASNGWVNDFKKRWRLSSRTPGKTHKVSTPNQFDIKLFQQRIETILENQQLERIINFDETRINVVPPVLSTIATKGTESVHLRNNSDPHAAFTAGMSVSAAGDMLPLFFISAESINKKLSTIQGTNSSFNSSPRSFMTSELMVKYLHHLRKSFDSQSSTNDAEPKDDEDEDEKQATLFLQEEEEFFLHYAKYATEAEVC